MKNLVPGTMGYGYFKSKMTVFWKKKSHLQDLKIQGNIKARGCTVQENKRLRVYLAYISTVGKQKKNYLFQSWKNI